MKGRIQVSYEFFLVDVKDSKLEEESLNRIWEKYSQFNAAIIDAQFNAAITDDEEGEQSYDEEGKQSFLYIRGRNSRIFLEMSASEAYDKICKKLSEYFLPSAIPRVVKYLEQDGIGITLFNADEICLGDVFA